MGNRIDTLPDRHLPGLVRLVNAHARLVPPGWALTAEQVARIVESCASLWDLHYPREGDSAGRATWRTPCLVRDGRLAAAAQWMRPAPDDASFSPENRDTAFVQWIVAEPGSPEIAEALARDVVREAAALGCGSVECSSRNAFGVGWFGVPDSWPHVTEGLARAGFAEGERWAIFRAKTDVGDAPPPPEPCHLDWAEDPERDERRLSVRKGDEFVGEFEAWGVPRHFEGCAGFSDWVTVEFIEIEAPFRRRGWGRWLLREGLRRLSRLGNGSAVLWTEAGNRPMLGLLESLGLVRGPACACLAKGL